MSADRLRSLLSRLNLSQRGAARLLRDAGVLATDRQVRAWCTGAEEVPEAAWLVLRKLAADEVTRIGQETGGYD